MNVYMICFTRTIKIKGSSGTQELFLSHNILDSRNIGKIISLKREFRFKKLIYIKEEETNGSR